MLVLFSIKKNSSKTSQKLRHPETFWTVQSIDAMKYSRDTAREKMNELSFDIVIQKQVSDIAGTGATHIGIGTPYDQEFLPFLQRWVSAARSNHLKVWFRGNFSGWENWFNYPKITRDQHLQMTRDFIVNNSKLFEDGDIFSSCPECENGGPGDPRHTGDVTGFRQFIISENKTAQTAFADIHKQVASNYFSMNGDVAKLVMDKDTTAKLGGVVTIDHYVSSPDKMITDIDALADSSGGKIILGEFGAPIPDLNGNFTDEQQKNWMQETLDKLASDKNVIGLNYWVSVGGSTQIWTESGNIKPAAEMLVNYYKPTLVAGQVVNELSQPITNATAATAYREVHTDNSGRFVIPVVGGKSSSLQISAPNFVSRIGNVDSLSSQVVLKKIHESGWFKFWKMVNSK
ncbi:MAG TPA: carboxypeptidase-like regulatory domain-containing protein [Patescibacteria group bacterium]